MNIGVVGSGSWATAIVKILSEGDNNIVWLLRSQEAVDFVLKNKHNPKHLTEVRFNIKKVKPICNISELGQVSIIIIAVPSTFIDNSLIGVSTIDLKSKLVVSATKGLHPETGETISTFLQNKFSLIPEQVLVLSGPCHAEEVALDKQSFLTVAGKKAEFVERIQNLFTTKYIHTDTTLDVLGVEYAAVLKNIYALAAGISFSQNYGDNFQAVLSSNALKEMRHFLEQKVGGYRDLLNSVYAGDLLVTAYSQFSRNRTFGSMIGRGYTVRSVMIDMDMVAEGYYAAKLVAETIKKKENDYPIIEMVYNILYRKKSPNSELKKLIKRLN